MSFRNGSYATVWEIKPMSDTFTKGRISTSRKNKVTGEYETDFSGFVSFIGTAAANKAIKLQERDRIKLNNVDVTTVYNKERRVQYTNFNIFDFDIVDNKNSGNSSYSDYHSPANGDPDPSVGDGEVEDSGLPF